MKFPRIAALAVCASLVGLAVATPARADHYRPRPSVQFVGHFPFPFPPFFSFFGHRHAPHYRHYGHYGHGHPYHRHTSSCRGGGRYDDRRYGSRDYHRGYDRHRGHDGHRGRDGHRGHDRHDRGGYGFRR